MEKSGNENHQFCEENLFDQAAFDPSTNILHDIVYVVEAHKDAAEDTNSFRIVISNSVLDVFCLTEWTKSPKAGAVCIFLGTTRDNFDGKEVQKLEYEAYSTMAIKEMQKLAKDMLQRWPLCKVAMAHRIGEVPVTESSVLIAVSCPHRKQSFEAAEFGIDQLKASVPIWKKEVYTDGTTSWKENKEFHSTSQNLQE